MYFDKNESEKYQMDLKASEFCKEAEQKNSMQSYPTQIEYVKMLSVYAHAWEELKSERHPTILSLLLYTFIRSMHVVFCNFLSLVFLSC